MCTSLTTFSLSKLAGEIEAEREILNTVFQEHEEDMQSDHDLLNDMDEEDQFLKGAAAVLRYLANPSDNPFDIKEGRSIFTNHGYKVRFPS